MLLDLRDPAAQVAPGQRRLAPSGSGLCAAVRLGFHRSSSRRTARQRYLHFARFLAATPTCTMRGLSTPATPTYLNTWLSISRLRACWMTIFLSPVISGQNADACG